MIVDVQNEYLVTDRQEVVFETNSLSAAISFAVGRGSGAVCAVMSKCCHSGAEITPSNEPRNTLESQKTS